MRRGAPRPGLVAATVALLALISACAPDRPAASPYADDLEAAAQAATTDVERRILADRSITPSEYEEAVGLYVACMEERGFAVTRTDHGGAYTFTFDYEPGLDLDQHDVECSEGTMSLVGALYVEQFLNPAKEDIDEVVARCLVRHGSVEPGYDGARLRAENDRGAATSYDMADAETVSCFTNPQG